MDEALVKAPDNVVRAILTALCADEAICAKANAIMKKIVSKTDSKDPESSNTIETNTRKRKATDEVNICFQCEQPFYENENSAKACEFHTGYLEVNDDDDFWAGYNDEHYGPIDTDEMRKENPEGFTWDCCGKDGNAAGCIRGRHRVIDPTKGRYGDDSGDDRLEEEEI